MYPSKALASLAEEAESRTVFIVGFTAVGVGGMLVEACKRSDRPSTFVYPVEQVNNFLIFKKLFQIQL